MPELCDSIHPTGPGHLGVARARHHCARQSGPAAPDPVPHARRERVPEPAMAFARCRAITPSIPTSSRCSGQEYRVELSAGGIGHRHVRRQLQLARPDLDAGQRAAHPRPAAVLSRTTATTSRSNARPAPAVLMNLFEVAREIANRLIAHLSARRAAAGGRCTAAPRNSRRDPHWRDYLLFYEYFHGDNGAGLGASHQTGWTGGRRPLIEHVRPARGRDASWPGGTRGGLPAQRAGTPDASTSDAEDR